MASLCSGFCNDRNSRNARYLSLASFVMYTALCESTGITRVTSLPARFERIERGCACCSNDVPPASRECTHRLDLVKCRSGIWKQRPPCSLIPTTFSRPAAVAVECTTMAFESPAPGRCRDASSNFSASFITSLLKDCNYLPLRYIIFFDNYINILICSVPFLRLNNVFSLSFLCVASRSDVEKRFNNASRCKFLG